MSRGRFSPFLGNALAATRVEVHAIANSRLFRDAPYELSFELYSRMLQALASTPREAWAEALEQVAHDVLERAPQEIAVAWDPLEPDDRLLWGNSGPVWCLRTRERAA